jgi:hypothetical protein
MMDITGMDVIEHGSWTLYVPAVPKEDLPGYIMYCQRDADGQDWYDYIHGEEPELGGNSIKMTVDGASIVQAVYRDATKLFPQSMLLLEVTDDPVADPQAKYGGMLYNAEDKSFTDPPPPPAEPSIPETFTELFTRIRDLRNRIDELERRPR